jgi:hypothetical protein
MRLEFLCQPRFFFSFTFLHWGNSPTKIRSEAESDLVDASTAPPFARRKVGEAIHLIG